MKSHNQILFGWLLLFPVLTLASNELPIEPYPPELLAEVADGHGIADATVPQLRTIAERGAFSPQSEAIKELIARADVATVARLVHALRRGNSLAEHILLDTASLPVVIYLLEDVAHGSMERYDPIGGPGIGQVRVAATAIVTKALAGTPGLPTATVAWFESLRRTGSVCPIIFVPEQSKAVIDWWTHNSSAMQTGKPEKATWLPDDKLLIPNAYTAWEKSRSAIPPPPPPSPPPVPPPHSSLPFSIAEPFGQWVERVAKLGNLDLKFAEVDFEAHPKSF